MLPVRVSGHRLYLGTDGAGGHCNYPTDLWTGPISRHAEHAFAPRSTGQVHFHPHEKSEMNGPRQITASVSTSATPSSPPSRIRSAPLSLSPHPLQLIHARCA